jgi:spermidine synthase
LKNTTEHAILLVVVTTGISSVVTQLVTIREFLTQFEGNEIVIALILFLWLILGGIGSLAARRISSRLLGTTVSALAYLSLALAALATVQLLGIRLLRDIVFIHGSSVGFYPTLAFMGMTVAPYALLLGFLLPYSLFVLRVQHPDFPGARIYIADNLGDVSGGMLFSFVLVFVTTPLKALLLAHIPMVAAVCRLQPGRRLLRWLAAIFTIGILTGGAIVETRTLAPPEGRLVYYRESRYGRIQVFRDQDQLTVFQDGVPVSSSQNISLAEEAIHYPMAQLTNPQRVLVIASQAGMMAELAKYRLKAVDYVELDPAVTDVQFQFGLLEPIAGLNVLHQDGRAYLASTKTVYDAVIVNLPEPETFQINRFFTKRFFDLARAHLTPQGILSFSMQGFDNYLSESQRQKLSSLFNTAKLCFRQVLLLPGQKIIFLCRNAAIEEDIPAQLTVKQIPTRYISRYFYGNLTQERIRQLNSLMDPKTARNTDDSPFLMRLMFQQWFAKYATSPTAFIAAVVMLTLIYFWRISREEYLLFATGCMTMGSEILVIFAFQIFFGYIYHQIGIIITVFLAGLLPGAWLGSRLRGGRERLSLALTDAMLAALLGLFIAAFVLGRDHLPAVFFLVYGFCVSVICGFQFPVALQLQGGDNRAATRAFSADLIGAAWGALVTSLVLIPYWGVIWATVALIGLKLTSLFVIEVFHDKVIPQGVCTG